MIQDENSLIDSADIELMSRVYELEAKARDVNIHELYRKHYAKKLRYIRDEIVRIVKEMDDAD